MGADDLNAALAHVVLACVSSQGVGYGGSSYSRPGMHVNLCLHGILGLLEFQSGTIGLDVNKFYQISLFASKYLPIPFLMADVKRNHREICALHAISGVIPFVLALTGKDNVPLGNLVIAGNLVALCYNSYQWNRDWGWFTAAAAGITYFALTNIGGPKNVMYPLGLAVMDYCAYRLFNLDI